MKHARVWSVVGLLAACSGEFRFDEHDPVDAAQEAPLEDAASGAACGGDADCPVATLHCDIVSGQCVACVADANCADPAYPRCDQALHRCVECGIDADCPTGSICEGTTRRCAPSCADNDCDRLGLSCSRPICVACFDSGDCGRETGSSTPHCDQAIGQCVACVHDDDCPRSRPRCDRTRGECRGCLDGSDCPSASPYCDPLAGECLAGAAE